MVALMVECNAWVRTFLLCPGRLVEVFTTVGNHVGIPQARLVLLLPFFGLLTSFIHHHHFRFRFRFRLRCLTTVPFKDGALEIVSAEEVDDSVSSR